MMNEKKVPRKHHKWNWKVSTAILLIVVFVLSVFVGAEATNIGNQAYPNGYNSAGPALNADYTIFTWTNNTGTFYGAKNQYGQLMVSWTSTNAEITFADVMASNTNIYVSTGTYGFDTQLHVVGLTNFQLTAGFGTIIQRPDNTNYTNYDRTDAYYYPMAIIENCSNFIISGFSFDGNAGNNAIQDPSASGDGGNINLLLEGCSQGQITSCNSYNSWGDPLNICDSEYITVSNVNMTNTAYYAYPYSYCIGGSQHVTTENVNIVGYAKAVEQYGDAVLDPTLIWNNEYLSYTNLVYTQNWTDNPFLYTGKSVMNGSFVSYQGSHISLTNCQFYTNVSSSYGNGIVIGASVGLNLPPTTDWVIDHCEIDSGTASQAINAQNATHIIIQNSNMTGGNYNIIFNNVNDSQIVGNTFTGSVNPNMRITLGSEPCYNTIISRNTFGVTSVNPSWGQIALASNGAYNTTIAFNNFEGSSVAWKAGTGVTGTQAYGNNPPDTSNNNNPYVPYVYPEFPFTGGATMTLDTAGRVYFCPIYVPYTMTVNGVLFCVEGGANSSVYATVGIYKGDFYNSTNNVYLPNGAALVAESSSTQIQYNSQKYTLAFSNTQLTAGWYFAVLTTNGNTLQVDREGGSFGGWGGRHIVCYYDQTYATPQATCPSVALGALFPYLVLTTSSVP